VVNNYFFSSILRITMPRPLTLLPLLLAFPVCLSAQAKNGFKRLEDREYPQAVEAFEKCFANNDRDTCACAFGLSKAYLAQRKDPANIELAEQYYLRCKACFQTAEKEQKEDWKEDYHFSAGSLKTHGRNLANAVWKVKGVTASIQEADVYLRHYESLNPENDTAAYKVCLKAVESVLKGSADYPLTRYVFDTRIEEWQRAESPKVPVMEQLLLEKYFKAKPGSSLRTFLAENPKHRFAQKTDSEAMLNAWESASLGPKLDRLAMNDDLLELTLFEEQVSALLKNDPSLSKKEGLTPGQAGVLDDMMGAGDSIALDDRIKIRQIKADLARNANVPFSDVEELNRTFVQQKKWPVAAYLLQQVEPYYPENKAWIESTLAIVSAPARNITKKNIGPSVNNAKSQYLPVISADGQSLYYCQEENGPRLFEDVYTSRLVDKRWTKGEIVPLLSTPGVNEAPLSISADGNYLIMFRNGKPFETTRTAGGWSEPRPLKLDLGRFEWVGTVQISANRQVMVFEASPTVPPTDIDIYISQANELGDWSKPLRLDAPINTEAVERSPYLHPDMTTLYFSSAGHSGLGGMDVFVTRRLDSTLTRWSEPVNLGKEINTVGEDWGYRVSTDGQSAWFATEVSKGNQDIFTAILPEEARPEAVCSFTVHLQDESGDPLDAEMVIENPLSGVKIGSFRSNPATGDVFLTLPTGSTYFYYVNKRNYFPESGRIDLHTCVNNKDTIALRAIRSMLETGKSVLLNNIFFDYDQVTLRPQSQFEIKRLVNLAKQENIKVELHGHTDNQGDETYNLELSQRRAEAVRSELIRLGLPENMVTTKGFGESKPLASNDTEEGKQQNRRVEVLFLK